MPFKAASSRCERLWCEWMRSALPGLGASGHADALRAGIFGQGEWVSGSVQWGEQRFQGCCRIVGCPDFIADAKEISDGAEFFDQSCGQRAFGDDRHFDHLGPPFEQVEFGAAAITERGFADGAKGRVIGPGFGGRDAFVAGCAAKRADDRVFAEVFADFAHRSCAVGQMDAIKAEAFDQKNMLLDYQRHIAGMGDKAKGIGGAGNAIFVLAGQGKTDAGDRGAVKHRCEALGKHLQIELGRGDEVKLRALGFGHGVSFDGNWPFLAQFGGLGYGGRLGKAVRGGYLAGMEQEIIQPAFILVRPQMGENIGAAARAMLNFGLDRMRIVDPRDGWPNPKANAMASGAGRVLDRAGIFPDTAAAIADCDYIFATTARGRELTKPVMTPERAMEYARELTAAGRKVGVLFGPERAGLENEDVVLANAIITVPVNPEFASLNLGQCVLLTAYEWRRQTEVVAPEVMGLARTEFASRVEVEKLGDHYESVLEGAGFFYPAPKIPGMKLSLRNMWGRLNLTKAEVQTFHGMLRQIAWKARQGGE